MLSERISDFTQIKLKSDGSSFTYQYSEIEQTSAERGHYYLKPEKLKSSQNHRTIYYLQEIFEDEVSAKAAALVPALYNAFGYPTPCPELVKLQDGKIALMRAMFEKQHGTISETGYYFSNQNSNQKKLQDDAFAKNQSENGMQVFEKLIDLIIGAHAENREKEWNCKIIDGNWRATAVSIQMSSIVRFNNFGQPFNFVKTHSIKENYDALLVTMQNNIQQIKKKFSEVGVLKFCNDMLWNSIVFSIFLYDEKKLDNFYNCLTRGLPNIEGEKIINDFISFLTNPPLDSLESFKGLDDIRKVLISYAPEDKQLEFFLEICTQCVHLTLCTQDVPQIKKEHISHIKNMQQIAALSFIFRKYMNYEFNFCYDLQYNVYLLTFGSRKVANNFITKYNINLPPNKSNNISLSSYEMNNLISTMKQQCPTQQWQKAEEIIAKINSRDNLGIPLEGAKVEVDKGNETQQNYFWNTISSIGRFFGFTSSTGLSEKTHEGKEAEVSWLGNAFNNIVQFINNIISGSDRSK